MSNNEKNNGFSNGEGSENNSSNKEYLNILAKIKNKVDAENQGSIEETNKEIAEKLGETVVLNRDDLFEAPKNTNHDLFSETMVTNRIVEESIVEQRNGNIILEVLGLKKKIGLKTIVDDINFEMREGEIIGLLGPNGSGKTTIMRMMVGLTKASKGEIYCLEKRLGLGYTKMLKEVGAMIESPEFYNYMSGYSNLKQLARLSGKKVKRSRIKELLKFVGLEKVARKKVKTYSLGMRQRLGLAQALLHDPKILILDEPVNGLDPQGVQDFRNKLKEIAASGVSILISSHLLDEIEKVSDRIIVLEKGKIIFDDTLDELRRDDIEKTLIEVYDEERAGKLIQELAIPYENYGKEFIFENLSREDKAKVLSYLINNYIEIKTVREVTKSLEERFLEITGRGGQE